MFNDNTFSAPWGRSLKLTTGLCLAIVLGIFLIGVIFEPKNVAYWKIGMLWIPCRPARSFLFLLDTQLPTHRIKIIYTAYRLEILNRSQGIGIHSGRSDRNE